MSMIADCTIFDVSQLDGLRAAAVPRKTGIFRRPKDTYHDFLAAKGTACPDFDWSGFYVVMALTWLAETRAVDLMKSEHDDLAGFLGEARQGTCFILTDTHRNRYGDSISQQSHSADDLTRYFEEFNEYEDPDSGEGMIDAMTWLKDCLARIEEGKIALLMIG